MKKIFSFITIAALFVAALCACTAKVEKAPTTTDLDRRIVEVVSIGDTEMVVAVCGGDYDGNEYAVDPVKNVGEGNVLNAIFDNNGTGTPIDDEIISFEARLFSVLLFCLATQWPSFNNLFVRSHTVIRRVCCTRLVTSHY